MSIKVPLLFTVLILSDMPMLSSEHFLEIQAQELASRLIAPYIVMALVFGVLIVLVKFSSLSKLEFEGNADESKESIFHFPRVVLGAVALFFYVGIEVIAGDTIGLYGQSLGFANALVWPTIWPLALEGLGKFTAQGGSALLIMAIAGGAILPLFFGKVAQYLDDML